MSEEQQASVGLQEVWEARQQNWMSRKQTRTCKLFQE